MSDSPVISQAVEAYEAIRAINHTTINRLHPAPVVYSVLGNLGNLGLDQALRQLGEGLERSLTTYEVVEDDGRDPAVSVALAVELLTEARAHAVQMCELLRRAQSAIARQGYTDDVEDH